MGKLEKLREINETLNKLLIELESRLFVDKICIDDDKLEIKSEENPVVNTNKI